MRVSEIFGSVNPANGIPVVQGEGARVGTPSVFLRLFGCNLRCPSFGISPPEKLKINPEAAIIIKNINNYHSLEDLPQVTTGCDTYYAIYPQFKRFAQDLSYEEVSYQLINRCHPFNSGKIQPDLVITGGEPLLHQRELTSLFSITPVLNYFKWVTFETNGTQMLRKDLIGCMQSFKTVNWVFSVSPKLSCSGHNRDETLDPSAVASYNLCNSQVYLKFVVHFDDNVDNYKQEVIEFIDEYKRANIAIDGVYIMPQGTQMSETYLNNARSAVKWCCEQGFKYSPRLQVELFGNNVGS